MLCYAFIDSVISFKSFNIRNKIWQIIEKFATRIWKYYFCISLCEQLEDKRSLNAIPWCRNNGYQNAYQFDPKDSAGEFHEEL